MVRSRSGWLGAAGLRGPSCPETNAQRLYVQQFSVGASAFARLCAVASAIANAGGVKLRLDCPFGGKQFRLRKHSFCGFVFQIGWIPVLAQDAFYFHADS